jgi:opacity protein-like surface antigen
MKKFNSLAAIAAIALTFSMNAAHADAHGWYGQGSVINLSAESDSDTIKGNGASVILGKNIGSGFSVEGQLIQQLSATKVDGETFKMSGYGIFGKYTFDGHNFKPYVRIGATNNTIKVTSSTGSDSVSESSVSFGAGANYSITPKLYLNLDLTQYYQKSSNGITGVSAGLGFKF